MSAETKNTFRLPQTSYRWFLVFFCSQLLMMNFAMPVGPAGIGKMLGRVFFRLFWLGPIIGSVIYLRRARSYQLTIEPDQIELTTSSGVKSFLYSSSDLAVTWKFQPGVVELASGGETARIVLREFHRCDRERIMMLVHECVPCHLQFGWPEFKEQRGQEIAKTTNRMRPTAQYGSALLIFAAVAIAIAAIVTQQLHLLFVAALHVVFNFMLRKNARRWLAEYERNDLTAQQMAIASD